MKIEIMALPSKGEGNNPLTKGSYTNEEATKNQCKGGGG